MSCHFGSCVSRGQLVCGVCADLTKEEQLCAWLQNQYKMACEILLEKLESEDAKLRVP